MSAKVMFVRRDKSGRGKLVGVAVSEVVCHRNRRTVLVQVQFVVRLK
jgi:hypothetical protein